MNVELKHTNPVEDVYHITDGCGNFATLIVGQCKALLYDTLMGWGDLRSYVEQLTSLPVIVMNSHCHLDHMGGNYQFEKIYCSEKDLKNLPEDFENTFKREPAEPYDLSVCRKSLQMTHLLENIDAGTVLDLGGIHAEIIALPGHTVGSLGVFVPERRVLFVGDAISPQMCLFLEGGLFLEDYRKTLKTAKALDFDVFLLSHFEMPYPKEILDEFEKCSLIPGTKRGFDYEYALIPEYKGIVYMHQARNKVINEMICIIVRQDEPELQKMNK